MPEETITFELIRKIQREEQRLPKLTKLPENFYKNVSLYLQQKRKIAESKEDRKIALETKNIERLIEDIFNRRERKILNQALIAARTKIPPENLTNEEKGFFEALTNSIKERRKAVLNKILSEKEEEVALIVFKEDAPEFVGSVASYTPIIIKDKKGLIDILPISDIMSFDGLGQEIKDVSGIWTISSHANQIGWNKWTEIKRILRHPFKGKLRRVITLSGLVDVSLNHSIVTKSGRVVDAKKLKEGKQLSMPVINPLPDDDSFFLGDEDLAWLYGYFAADGSVSGKYGVNIFSISKELLIKAKKIFEKHFKKKVSIFRDGNGYKISISNKQICNFFKDLFYTKEGHKKVPKIILNAPKKIKKAFIRGYMIGDGSYTPKLSWEFQSFSEQSHTLIQGILYLILATTKQSWSIHNRENSKEVIVKLNKGPKNRKNKRQIKKLKDFYHEGFLYDIETDNHKFVGGIGPITLHNSDLKTYGPFKKGDIAKLPEENVKVLIERGIAKEFKVER